MSERQTDFERFVKNDEAKRLFVQERTIVELTAEICRLMDAQRVTRTELARRLGKSKGQISQMLGGGRNLTLRSLSDMLLALGRSLEAVTRDADDVPRRYMCIPDGGGWERHERMHIPHTHRHAGRINISTPASSTRGAA